MELKLILESLLFAAQRPLSARELRGILTGAAEESGELAVTAFKKVKEEEVETCLEELQKDHEAAARSFRLVCVAGAWQFVTEPAYVPWLRLLVGEKVRPARLSQPALETLAIIAYRQPLTRAEMEQIRGVSVDGVLQTLVERGLIEQMGRAEVVGRPMTYGTTVQFLEYFGLRRLEDLPAADELRRIVVTKPEALLTADGGASSGESPGEPSPSPETPPATAAGEPELGGASGGSNAADETRSQEGMP